MKKLMVAMVAGMMSLAFAGAYAADDGKGKSDAKKSETASTKSDKGMSKSGEKSKSGDKDTKKASK